jgi:murein DD-endopeptidase MepM/ murein hydrolase activator NlpD
MNNRFTITINDDNGVRQINLHKFVHTAILYSLGFILFLIFVASGTILYLDGRVDEVQNKKIATQRAYEELREKNKALHSSMNDTKDSLLLKKKELDDLSDSLSEIQEMIGMGPAEEEKTLKERVDLTKITSEEMAILLQLVPSGSPVEYNGITSKFGFRIHPTLGTREFHRGTDLRAAMRTPVYATADGIVEYSGLHNKSGFGKLVIVDHALGFKTYYGHLNKLVIKSNEFVKKGDIIAYSGTSGMSNGPHLHYEIRFMFNVVNPYWFIKWTMQNYNEIFEREKKIPWQSLVTATSNLKVVKLTQTLQLLPQARK